MATPRRSSEEGHRRKFLVVIDDTPECSRALHYAARRAEHSGGALVLLFVIVPGEFQHWVGVENIMRAEAAEEAETILGRFADLARKWANIEPELVIREGNRAEEIVKLIDEDTDIAVLVLAAGIETEGPGPLVTQLVSKGAGTFAVPITVVPGSLDDAAIEAIT
jgi:nucleotide-binding universal stress UspA family protein